MVEVVRIEKEKRTPSLALGRGYTKRVCGRGGKDGKGKDDIVRGTGNGSGFRHDFVSF